MKFILLFLLALGAFVDGSVAQFAQGPLGPNGSGSSPSVGAANGAQGPSSRDPSQNAPGPTGPGGSGSNPNVRPANGQAAFGPARRTQGPLGPGGSGSSPNVRVANGPGSAQGAGSFVPGPLGRGGSGSSPKIQATSDPASFGPESTGPVIISPNSKNRPRCSKHEVYQRCGVGWQCEDYCGRGANACAYCENGCYCKKGYIRSGPEYTAKCVKKKNCPRARDPPIVENSGSQGPDVVIYEETVKVQCKVNEEYSVCGGCDQYCNREPVFCTLACNRPGCYCRLGYKRSFEGGICIPAKACPGAQPVGPGPIQSGRPQQCNINEVYSDCGLCDQYCNRGPISCSLACNRPGCYCRRGYKRSFEGGICIPANTCAVAGK